MLAGAPDVIGELLPLFDDGYRRLDVDLLAHGQAAPGQQRYSAATRQLAAQVFVVVKAVRDAVEPRRRTHAAAQELREKVGIGTYVAADRPMLVLDVGRRQLASLGEAQTVAQLQTVGVYAQPSKAQLGALLPRLARSIAAGVGGAPRQGEVSAEVNGDLLLVEVVLERAVAFFRSHGVADAAERLDDLLPRKSKGTAASSPNVPTPAPVVPVTAAPASASTLPST